MKSPQALWAEITKLLRDARQQLPLERDASKSSAVPVGLLTGTLDEFEEFLTHNELELAWDALSQVAGRIDTPAACWDKLARAARLLQLAEKEKEAARQASAARV
jgi:hypothetical protein